MSEWTYEARLHYGTCLQCNCSASRAQVIAHMERQRTQPLQARQEMLAEQQRQAQQYAQLQAEMLAAGCTCAGCVEARRRQAEALQPMQETSAYQNVIEGLAAQGPSWLDRIFRTREVPQRPGNVPYPQPEQDDSRDEQRDESRELVGV